MVTWGSAIRSRGRGACPLTPLNWNPHSLLQINPTPTPWPSTQLALVYTPYVYPPREEERDSKMDGFKLDIFYREAGINRSTGELAAPRLAEHKKLSGLIHWSFGETWQVFLSRPRGVRQQLLQRSLPLVVFHRRAGAELEWRQPSLCCGSKYIKICLAMLR